MEAAAWYFLCWARASAKRLEVFGISQTDDIERRKSDVWPRRISLSALDISLWLLCSRSRMCALIYTHIITHTHTHSTMAILHTISKVNSRGTYTCDKWPMKFKMIEQNDLTFANWWLVSSFVWTHFKIKCFPLSKNKFFEVVGYSIGSLYVT